MKDKSRRKFLKQSIGVSAAGAALLPRPLSAAMYSQVPGAADRIHVALIGCGGMGRNDLRDFLKVKHIECVALCDVDDAQVAQTLKQVTEPADQNPSLSTRDFRKVLDHKEIDAVIIATPDHWHALPTVMACRAGKDVYVEKPLSVSIAEGRVMLDEARRYDRVVQMGTQRRSAPHYAEAVEYVQSGNLGRVRLVRAWAYLDWKGEVPVKSDRRPTARGRLRHVAWASQETRFQSQPFPLDFPLVLGLLRRTDDRLGSTPDRCGELGNGHQSA